MQDIYSDKNAHDPNNKASDRYNSSDSSEKGFLEQELKVNPDEERLLHAFRQFHTMKPPEMASCGLARSDIRILFQIYSYVKKHEAENGISASMISQKTHMMKAAVSRSLKQLEKQGCILRVPDPNDRRYTLVSITDSGEEKITEILSSTQRLFDLISERLPTNEITNILKALDRLYQAMSESIDQMESERNLEMK